MGQRYHAVLVKKNGRIAAINNPSGKLMEHSYIDNSYVCSVAAQIAAEPHRVFWMGEYAGGVISPCSGNSDILSEYDEKEKIRCFTDTNDALLGRCDKAAWEGKTVSAVDAPTVNMKVGYLCNHTKKEYINLAVYCERLVATAYGNNKRYVINPLSLLTAIGNRRNGGDYYPENPNYSSVGIWAGDFISYEAEEPSDMQNVSFKYLFSE